MEATQDDLTTVRPRRRLPWGVPLLLGVLTAVLFWQVYGWLHLFGRIQAGNVWAVFGLTVVLAAVVVGPRLPLRLAATAFVALAWLLWIGGVAMYVATFAPGAPASGLITALVAVLCAEIVGQWTYRRLGDSRVRLVLVMGIGAVGIWMIVATTLDVRPLID